MQRVSKGGEDFGVAANVDEDAGEGATADGGEAAEMVIDIVDGFKVSAADRQTEREGGREWGGGAENTQCTPLAVRVGDGVM